MRNSGCEMRHGRRSRTSECGSEYEERTYNGNNEQQRQDNDDCSSLIHGNRMLFPGITHYIMSYYNIICHTIVYPVQALLNI